MQLPAELRAATAQALEGVSRTELARRAERMSELYRGGGMSAAAVRDETDALAYAVSRMPATFAAVRNVFARLQERCPEFDPRSMLDLGAGPGTASWAASEAWPAIETVTQVDSNPGLTTLGAKLAEASLSRALRTARRESADLAKQDFPGLGADLVILAYTVGEIAPHASIGALGAAWSACSEALVIVEPGTPKGFEGILRARDLLLGEGARIVAPCPHERACPLAAPDWCHFAQRVARTRDHMLLKSAELPWEDEKFSYIIAVREDVFTAPEKGRILAQPEAGKAAVQVKLCKRDGTAALVQIARRDAHAFKQARKKNWGDEF